MNLYYNEVARQTENKNKKNKIPQKNRDKISVTVRQNARTNEISPMKRIE